MAQIAKPKILDVGFAAGTAKSHAYLCWSDPGEDAIRWLQVTVSAGGRFRQLNLLFGTNRNDLALHGPERFPSHRMLQTELYAVKYYFQKRNGENKKKASHKHLASHFC